MRVILRAVFGLDEGVRYEQMERLLGGLLDDMSNPLSVSLLYFPILRQNLGPLSPWGRFVRERQRIDQLIYAEIAERRMRLNASRNDILTLLMSARDEAGEARRLG
jgi:cytochrome P450 family 110